MLFFFVLLSFCFAFAGIWNEYLLAQYINGLLGGGYQVVFFTFTVFAASLGLGSILFNFIPHRIRTWRTLAGVQIFVGFFSLMIPRYFELLSSQGAGLFLALMPAAVLGAATGLEIPFLYYKSRIAISKILASDYLGMFLGIILYPIMVSARFQIRGMIIFNSFISLFLGILLFFFREPVSEGPRVLKSEASLPRSPFAAACVLAFVLSFCSFAYQNLAGKLIVSVVGENLFTQSYVLGFFIFGMALGAFIVDRKKRTAQESFSRLALVETWICVISATIPLVVYFAAGSFFLFEGTLIVLSENALVMSMSLIFSLFTMLIGALTGMELPLLFGWLNLSSEDRRSFWLIAANYSAALVAGAFCAFYLASLLGHSYSFVLIVAINLMALLYIQTKRGLLLKLKEFTPIGLVVVAVFLNTRYLNASRNFFLDIYYSKFSTVEFSWPGIKNTLKAVQYEGRTSRIESFYQNIDLRSTYGSAVEGREESFALFLNKQPQFDSLIYQNYHGSMVAAAKSFLLEKPQKVLVLGAGDGLLARAMLDVFPTLQMTLVEIDPEMIRLSQEMLPISSLNLGSLSDPRVRVEIGDAYSYVRTTSEQFDLVLVDFPYPTNIDLSRLYSFEFYSGVRRVLSASGVAILDAPINFDFAGDTVTHRSPVVRQLLATLYYAGFKEPFCFGPFDPFIAIAKDNRKLQIDFEKTREVKNSIFVNLRDLHHLIGDIQFNQEDVNYVLSPTILGL